MVYCSALQCRNATSGINKNASVSFYGFPLENQPLLEQWIQNMGKGRRTPSKYQRLCSQHFEESCFGGAPWKPPRKRRLLKGAVPNRFILGANGNWLVGTPQNGCDTMRNQTGRRAPNPPAWMVSQKFPNGAEWPTWEDWQNEFYKAVLKEIYSSLTTLRKGFPVPRSKIQAAQAAWAKIQEDLQRRKAPARLGAGRAGGTLRSQLQARAATQRRGSSPGGFQNLLRNVPAQGEPSGPQQLPKARANAAGQAGGRSPPAGRPQPQEPEAPWFICTECGKSFARHLYLVRHRKIHWKVRPHKCTECGKSFLEKCRLKYHMKTHAQKTHVPNAFLA